MTSRQCAPLVAMFLCLMIASACDDGGSGTPDAGGDSGVPDGGDESPIDNETCPDECEVNPRCEAGFIESCCACVFVPSAEAERCTSENCDEYAGTGDVDVSCFANNPWEEDLPEGTVRLVGVVDVYATGGNSTDGIHIEFYRMNDDATLGAQVGEFITDDAATPCDERSVELEPFLVESGDEAEHCPGICTEEIPDTHGDCRELGYYYVDGIPTHVPLVVVTWGDDLWRHMYAYNVIFFDSEAQTMDVEGTSAPTIFYKARVLSNGDFSAIPMTAGMPQGIPESHGAVAGEVHDCGDIRVRNVQVGIEPVPGGLIYFNGNESKPYPDGTRRIGTNWLGLFAGLDIDPDDNPVRVSAVGVVDGELVSFGWAMALVYPGAVTSMTLRGPRPGIDVFPSPE